MTDESLKQSGDYGQRIAALEQAGDLQAARDLRANWWEFLDELPWTEYFNARDAYWEGYRRK